MNLRHGVIIGICLFLCNVLCAQPHESDTTQHVIVSDTTTMLRIVPSDFESALDVLVRDWYVTNSFVIDCDERNAHVEPLTDSLCIERLEKISLGMTLPYNTIVRSFIDSYLRRQQQVEYMLGLGESYYFPIFEAALEKYQVPLELKYLPVIESALNARALSRAGASGLWQFIITTGRNYDLEVNTLVDERRDPIKASDAAAHYLHDLYEIYGDWFLAIASYNCGPGNVAKAIRAAGGKRNYWDIYPYLPQETRSYVPIFIAANYIMNYYVEHGMCPARPRYQTTVDSIIVNQRIHLQQISDILSVPIEELRFLNPQYRHDIVPGNIKPYPVVLPMSLMAAFEKNQDTIARYHAAELVAQSMQAAPPERSTASYSRGHVIYYKVRRGDTLNSIARKYRTTILNIKRWNGLRSTTIRVGQRLKICK